MKKRGLERMGIYLNPNGEAFEIAVQSDIYVDKTGMLLYLNSVLGKEQRFVCVSRPRRFGKSIAEHGISILFQTVGCGRDFPRADD